MDSEHRQQFLLVIDLCPMQFCQQKIGSSRKIIVNIHRTSTRESCFSSSTGFGRIRGSLCVQQLWWALLYFDVSSMYFRQSRRNSVCYLCLLSLQCLKLLRNLFLLLYNCRCRNKGDICVIIWQKYFITCTKFDRCFGRKSNHNLCSQNTDLDMILFSFCFSFFYILPTRLAQRSSLIGHYSFNWSLFRQQYSICL